MLLELNDLSVSFNTDDGTEQVLEGVSFAMEAGETMALVGESGSGKSVTALSILRLLETVAAVNTSGRILFEGQELLTLTEPAMRRIRGNRIAMIFQEPMTSMNPVYTVGDQLMEPLMVHQGLARDKAKQRAMELLHRTGIPDPGERLASFPHQLSGGQRQRVMIAMALACRPKLLIADEPTTALDVTIQAQILELIKDVQQELGMAVLLITHDLNMVRKIADRVNIMCQGSIVEHGDTAQVMEKPSHPYTVKLLDSVPKGEAVPKGERPVVLQVRDLKCHFPIKKGFLKRTVGTVRAVDGVDLIVREGTTCGIVGESGSGKTTLGMAILRLTGCRGDIVYQGRDLLACSRRELRPLRKELQVVFQDPFSSLSPRLTVEQIIAEGLKVHNIGADRRERRRIVEETLMEVGLEPGMADRYPHEFSGGQRQRIAIARAVALRPRLVVLDEPTSALDMTVQAQIIALLKRLQESHRMTYLFISHDLRTVRALADDIAVMQNGRVVEAGPAHDLFANPQHPYTRALFAAAFHLAVAG
ncbi:MAG: ABC transporter ATP-binding protein [Desulfobulbaceae bacterium]|nr:ABC transporter ATP-binding protein [Desulfobulbaceae bacterium]